MAFCRLTHSGSRASLRMHLAERQMYRATFSSATRACPRYTKFYQYFGIDQYFRPIDSYPHLWPNPNLKANLPEKNMSRVTKRFVVIGGLSLFTLGRIIEAVHTSKHP